MCGVSSTSGCVVRIGRSLMMWSGLAMSFISRPSKTGKMPWLLWKSLCTGDVSLC